jgi:hypothetical protein
METTHVSQDATASDDVKDSDVDESETASTFERYTGCRSRIVENRLTPAEIEQSRQDKRTSADTARAAFPPKSANSPRR